MTKKSKRYFIPIKLYSNRFSTPIDIKSDIDLWQEISITSISILLINTMRLSQLFTKVRKEDPAHEDSTNARLLIK